MPIGLAFLFIALIVQHGGFRPASDADRFIATKSSGPAGNSIRDSRASEEVWGASSVAKNATPAGSSDAMGGAGDTPAGSGTTPVESGTPTSVNEPGTGEVFNGMVSFGKEAGLDIEPAASELTGGSGTGSSKLPTNDGPTIPAIQPKVKEVVTGIASLAMEERGAVEPAATTAKSSPSSIDAGATISFTESKLNGTSGGVASSAKEKSGAIGPDGSKIAGGIADSRPPADLVAPKLQPAVHNADLLSLVI